MFVDLGRSATLPVQSLCGLDSDNFRAIPPLTQPFMLDKGPDTCRASVSTPSGWRCLFSAFVFVLLSRHFEFGPGDPSLVF
ncbi:tudor domain-containing protein 10 [Panthera leo]|uniref:tudor domain-containing protein 10 n=1 Tax=Panthera leo TaxID=9689 RepID=UPI001C6A591D|nr:tudor domain-containing protein 10 [Panthera leo]